MQDPKTKTHEAIYSGQKVVDYEGEKMDAAERVKNEEKAHQESGINYT